MLISLITVLSFIPLALAQVGVVNPLVQHCGPSNVVCVNRYAAVMPYHFFRPDSFNGTSIPFSATSVPNDTSFSLLNNSNFIVYDRERGLAILGANPTYEKVFNVSEAVHEAPVYVPGLNKLFLSQLAPPAGFLPQLVVDLNKEPPELSEFLSDPPVYAPNGGTFHKGLIYWGASGGNNSIGGTEQRAGIRTLDPHTNKTTTLLNNYFGWYFNTVDDLFVDSRGDVWFTDPDYSWFNALTDTAPQLRSQSYRFRPSTGQVWVIDDTLGQPNGIAISPEGRNIYISDTSSVDGVISSAYPHLHASHWNQTSAHTIYKYDLLDDAVSGEVALINKRPFYYSQEWVPDGLKVAQNGYVVTGAGKGVDVLDCSGSLVLRIQTDYVVQNFAWAGGNLTEFWLMGQGGISRVKWELKGQDLSKSYT
ncbi:putative lactonohydrolase [Aureobasidium namibiae CBS 147.97]|uniref:Putative lactonohydrolase n=1 Tax=Aureobasidium namibiae CBS 147.97 TaxID=1043004 RepID=A0A074WFG0_9PEZI